MSKLRHRESWYSRTKKELEEMDYEKAYKAVLETATNWIKDGCTDKEKICLESVFPELRSEDDKIWEWFHESVEKGAFLIYEPCEREKILAYLEKWKDQFRVGPGLYLYDGEHTKFCGELLTEEKQKEQTIKTDACGFPIRDEGESACSYLERCLAPDMRSIWYEACKEIKEKLKPTEWTEMNYEKEYKMALERCRWQLANGRISEESATDLFRDLHGSEDVKIIEKIIDCLNRAVDAKYITLADRVKCLAYLAEPKEVFEYGRGLYYYDGEKTTYCGYPATEENPYDFAMSQQKKPRDYRKLYEDIAQSEWFKKAYVGKSLGEEFEQKPTWSEEDEEMRKNILWVLESFMSKAECEQSPGLTTTYPTYFKEIAWLKSLPGRFNLEPKEEWSEEDEKRIKQLIYDTEHIRAEYEKKKEKLGEDFNNSLIKDCDEQIAWLKSLRPSWKPSEEQMDALKSKLPIIKGTGNNVDSILESLYEQLKKL